MDDWHEYLEEIYYDPQHPSSYSGLEKLYRTIKEDGKFRITRTQLRKWLQKQETYTLHRRTQRQKRKLHVLSPEVDFQWDCDLADMASQTKHNKGWRYFLIAAVVLSRYVWTRPLKTKSGKNVTTAFQSIMEGGRKPQKIRTDRGKEFYNESLQTFLREESVHHFSSEGDGKANYAERAIKTIKGRLARYMTQKNTHKWLNVLQSVTDSYNRTYHTSIKTTPQNVGIHSSAQIWKRVYLDPIMNSKPFITKYRFDVGDKVRVSHLKHVFKREYDERWTREVFLIVERRVKENIPCYKLKDFDNEPVSGIFYENEMQKVDVDDDAVYKIDKNARQKGARRCARTLCEMARLA